MLFLIEYDRAKGEVISMKRFDASEKSTADAARLELELQLNRRGVAREVVLLEADTEGDLRQTHRRYFESFEDLAKAS